MAGACGGQRCLAGDGALTSSEMPAAKVILLFLSPLNLKAADVRAVVLPQLWPVTASRTPYSSIHRPHSPGTLSCSVSPMRGQVPPPWLCGSETGGLGEVGWGQHGDSPTSERYGLGKRRGDQLHCKGKGMLSRSTSMS